MGLSPGDRDVGCSAVGMEGLRTAVPWGSGTAWAKGGGTLGGDWGSRGWAEALHWAVVDVGHAGGVRMGWVWWCPWDQGCEEAVLEGADGQAPRAHMPRGKEQQRMVGWERRKGCLGRVLANGGVSPGIQLLQAMGLWMLRSGVTGKMQCVWRRTLGQGASGGC